MYRPKYVVKYTLELQHRCDIILLTNDSYVIKNNEYQLSDLIKSPLIKSRYNTYSLSNNFAFLVSNKYVAFYSREYETEMVAKSANTLTFDEFIIKQLLE